MKDVRVREKGSSLWKNKKVLTLFMGLFIISLMVFSVLYYGLDTTGQEKVDYNGLQFVQTNQGWQAYTEDEQRILISSNPKDLETIRFSFVSLDFLNQMQKVYVSFNPYDDVSGALYDFQQNVPLSGVVVAACYEDNDLCAELPLKTCADAESSVAVVVFREANETFVSLEENCLTIQGKDLLGLTDTLILEQYGSIAG